MGAGNFQVSHWMKQEHYAYKRVQIVFFRNRAIGFAVLELGSRVSIKGKFVRKFIGHKRHLDHRL